MQGLARNIALMELRTSHNHASSMLLTTPRRPRYDRRQPVPLCSLRPGLCTPIFACFPWQHRFTFTWCWSCFDVFAQLSNIICASEIVVKRILVGYIPASLVIWLLDLPIRSALHL